MVVYFLITAGIVYDIINEPPSIGKLFSLFLLFFRCFHSFRGLYCCLLGAAVDERGIQRPQVIMPYRLNGQYIMEGLVAAFLFMLTGNKFENIG